MWPKHLKLLKDNSERRAVDPDYRAVTSKLPMTETHPVTRSKGVVQPAPKDKMPTYMNRREKKEVASKIAKDLKNKLLVIDEDHVLWLSTFEHDES